MRERIAESMGRAVGAEGAVVKNEHEVKPGARRRMEEYGRGRDDYKDGLVYSERKNVLRDFGRKAYNKCSCCGA